jgi:SOS-response transcriptional repressor LexA
MNADLDINSITGNLLMTTPNPLRTENWQVAAGDEIAIDAHLSPKPGTFVVARIATG